MNKTMNRFDVLITAYSLILLIGGVIGYLVASSFTSLLMSSIFAILLIGSLFWIRFSPQLGYKAVLLLLSILTLFFAYRWYSVKFFPSGILCIFTLVILGLAFPLRQNK